MLVLIWLFACSSSASCSDVDGCPGVAACCDGEECWYERDDGDRIACSGTDCSDAAAEAVSAWCR